MTVQLDDDVSIDEVRSNTLKMRSVRRRGVVSTALALVASTAVLVSCSASSSGPTPVVTTVHPNLPDIEGTAILPEPGPPLGGPPQQPDQDAAAEATVGLADAAGDVE